MIEAWAHGEVVIDQALLNNNGELARVNSFVTKSSGTWGGEIKIYETSKRSK